MFAAHPEGFETALTNGRDIDPELSHTVVDGS